MRYRLIIEYDGAEFCGWQSQADGRAVQDALQHAIASFCGETVTVYGAGRTDSGVHARGQVAHIDLESRRTRPRADGSIFICARRRWRFASLYARADFDARFSALRVISLSHHIAARAGCVGARSGMVGAATADVAAMREASQYLLGKHDFRHFGPASAGQLACAYARCAGCVGR